jgi:integrase
MSERAKNGNKRTRSQYAKSDLRYWQDVIYKPRFGNAGNREESEFYVVRIGFGGRRTTFPLGTNNKAAAATRARDIYNAIQANGWEAANRAFKKEHRRSCPTTVGELVCEAQKHLDVRPLSFGGYARSFRKIVSDIFAFDPGPAKHDYHSGGRQLWLSKVDSVRLEKLSPLSIAEWRSAFLERAGSDQAALRSARISAASFIREARALFAPAVLKHLEGVSSPFEGIPAHERISTRYKSEVRDLADLIEDGCRELNNEEGRECFKVFLLATFAGLRRSEIDLLEWSSLDFAKGIVRIEATKYFAGKSESSLGDIPMDPELLELFREFKQHDNGQFVIRSDRAPKTGRSYTYCRCQPTFDRLVEWLRSKGIRGRNPIHVLRKEFGSAMAQKYGIFAASRALRHSSVSVTESHYVTQKRTASVGLGHLLKAPDNIVDFKSAGEGAASTVSPQPIGSSTVKIDAV